MMSIATAEMLVELHVNLNKSTPSSDMEVFTDDMLTRIVPLIVKHSTVISSVWFVKSITPSACTLNDV
jgi:hypothetical protein